MMRKSPGILVSVVFIAAIFQGCASTQVTRLSDRSYPEKAENCSMPILSEAPKDKKYEEVCLVNGRGGQSLFESKDVAGLLPEMKQEACKCGADAIVLKNSKAGGYNFAGPADRAEASGVAIHYTQQLSEIQATPFLVRLHSTNLRGRSTWDPPFENVSFGEDDKKRLAEAGRASVEMAQRRDSFEIQV